MIIQSVFKIKRLSLMPVMGKIDESSYTYNQAIYEEELVLKNAVE